MSESDHPDSPADPVEPTGAKKTAGPGEDAASRPENGVKASSPRDTISPSTRPYSRRRVRLGLILTLIGFFVFLVGIRPDIIGLDRSPIIGFVQIAVFLIGLAIICLGGYFSLMALWKHQTPSIAVDFGVRLVATGYVVAVFSGMADVFGFGSHTLPAVPFFGPWQERGVMLGQAIIAVGFLLLIPYPERKQE